MTEPWSCGCTQAQLHELEEIEDRVEEANAPERKAERQACFLRRLNLKKRRIELHERLLGRPFEIPAESVEETLYRALR